MAINKSYLLRLIRASQILTPKQKAQVEKKLSRFSVVDQAELQILLEKEQKIHQRYYQKVIDILKRFFTEKARILQRQKSKKEEASRQRAENILLELEDL